MTAPTIPAAPTVTIGTDPTGAPVTIPTGGILITGDNGTGKTVLATRIAAARTTRPHASVLWAVHDWAVHAAASGWTHPLAELADWSAGHRPQAARMLDTAHSVVRASRHTPDTARLLLAVDAEYLLPEGWTDHAAPLATAGHGHGLDLLLITDRHGLLHLPDALGREIPTRISFRQTDPRAAARAADLLGLDSPDALRDLPHVGAAYVRYPGADPVLVTIPA